MNPGGDYGKKELSPALANRFTTIWVPALQRAEELKAIVEQRLDGRLFGWLLGGRVSQHNPDAPQHNPDASQRNPVHLNTTAFSISTPPSHTDVCRQAGIATRLVEFFEVFKTQPSAHSVPLCVRDLLSWSDFVCRLAPTCGPLGAYVHGAFLCLLDGVGLGTGASTQVCVKGGFLTDYVYRWYMKGIVLYTQK